MSPQGVNLLPVNTPIRIPALPSVRLLAGLACVFLALACAGKFLPQPSEAQAAFATRSGTPSSLSSLQQGRQLFVAKCDGCHELPYVQDHDPEKWASIMDKMRVQAKLSDREDYLIRTYLVSSSAWVRDSLSIR